MKNILSFGVTAFLIVTYVGCVGFENWLQPDIISVIRSEPVAIFECEIQTSESDTLILLGTSDSSLISGYKKFKTIGFFLKNKNLDPAATHPSKEEAPHYISFDQVEDRYSVGLVKGFPQLTGMEIFSAYLKALTVKKEDVLRFNILGDGDLRNMLPRQIEYIRNRRVILIAIKLPNGNSVQYQK